MLYKDTRWEIFDITVTNDSFEKNIIPKVFLKESVPTDIHDSFKIITKLFQFSYYEYEFMTVAIKQSIFTFEMALNLKYSQIENKRSSNSLHKLIKWVEKQGLFSEEQTSLVNNIRLIRNSYAHPQLNSVSPPSHISIVNEIAELINKLY